MNELRGLCLKIIESLEEAIESNGFGYSCLNEEKAIHLLEAFAREQRIKGVEDAMNIVQSSLVDLRKEITSEIQRMREEGGK